MDHRPQSDTHSCFEVCFSYAVSNTPTTRMFLSFPSSFHFSLRLTESPVGTGLDRCSCQNLVRVPVEPGTYGVWVDGIQTRLRPTEYRLLYHLVNNAGWVMSHETLLSKVWGPGYRDEIQYLRLYINYLRKKIEVSPSDPHYILTERGIGYRFMDFRELGSADQQ